jgi:hypothetical protein
VRTFFFATTSLFALAALGCTGSSIGNPPGADIQLGVVGRSGPMPAALEIAGGVTIDQAWIALQDVDLRNLGTCTGEDDMSYDVSGPVAADLLKGQVYPAAPQWVRPGNEIYCALQTKLEVLETNIPGTPTELGGHTVFVTGTRGDTTPFEVRNDLSSRLDLGPSAAGGFILGTGSKGMLLVFDLAEWLDASLLNAADVSDGMILIDRDNNTNIASDLEDRIPQSAILFRDGNRDGMLNENDDNESISD